MSDRQKRIENAILITLYDWSQCGGSEFDGFWYGYEALRELISVEVQEPISVKELKSAMHRLRDLYLVRYATLVDHDYRLHGSGYVITVNGIEAYDQLKRDAKEGV